MKIAKRNPFAKEVHRMYNKIKPGKRYEPEICPTCKGAGYYPSLVPGWGESIYCGKCSGSGTL